MKESRQTLQVDLSAVVSTSREAWRLEERRIVPGSGPAYTARVHHFTHNGMVSTYIDFPGHVVDTDDGTDAGNAPLDRLFRVPATRIRLDRYGSPGGIGARELAAAVEGPLEPGGALVIDALAGRGPDSIPWRSVWLTSDAVDWIVAAGVRLLVSDVYESEALHGVFPALFAAGVYCVCNPANLGALVRSRFRLTVLPCRFQGVTQLPCRVVAEWDTEEE